MSINMLWCNAAGHSVLSWHSGGACGPECVRYAGDMSRFGLTVVGRVWKGLSSSEVIEMWSGVAQC